MMMAPLALLFNGAVCIIASSARTKGHDRRPIVQLAEIADNPKSSGLFAGGLISISLGISLAVITFLWGIFE